MKTLDFLKDSRRACPEEWKEMDEAIEELEALLNAKCTNCKHCDFVRNAMIHCNYFEELFPKELGKCDRWERG